MSIPTIRPVTKLRHVGDEEQHHEGYHDEQGDVVENAGNEAIAAVVGRDPADSSLVGTRNRGRATWHRRRRRRHPAGQRLVVMHDLRTYVMRELPAVIDRWRRA